MNPILIVLLVSLAANGLLGWAYLGQRDTAAAAVVQRDAARGDASACSDATEDLRMLADKRHAAAAPARAAASTAARTLNQRADYTLTRQPKDPANSCASLQALGDEWLQGRVKP